MVVYIPVRESNLGYNSLGKKGMYRRLHDAKAWVRRYRSRFPDLRMAIWVLDITETGVTVRGKVVPLPEAETGWSKLLEA